MEDKMVYTLSIIYIELLALPVVIVGDGIVMKIALKEMLGAVI